ncbi:hypothetical protein FOMPIDRAFT_1136964 [Fomitopsis schrenkii]|uniref:Uncharacterized protein n=1 Tax=Fomitopsis schrenkii TaxID=2126942 RepID=S8ETG9_FOMSC|nr:hypothetical protein FOMPIDRAFT_1136964 [Fomitopsis schrenkii]
MKPAEEVDSDVPSHVEPVAVASTSSRPKPQLKSRSNAAKGADKPAKAKSTDPPQPPRKRRNHVTSGPVKKRRRVILSDDESEDEEMPAPPPMRSTAKLQLQAKALSSEKENEHRSTGAESECSVHAEPRKPAAKKKRRVKEEEDEDAGVKTVTKKASSSSLARKSAFASELKRDAKTDKLAAKAVELDPASLPLPLSEMQGMLIETLATSRASSMPPSSLCTALMSSRPALKEYQSCEHEGPMERKEWIRVIEDVLETCSASSGVFEKVENTIRDMDHQLEAQWFYVPEKDEDEERATLIRSMMPRPGKRNETKKSKQYYWRPLGKISRWDPEDDL